jgi:hypothetical protein
MNDSVVERDWLPSRCPIRTVIDARATDRIDGSWRSSGRLTRTVIDPWCRAPDSSTARVGGRMAATMTGNVT